VREPNRAVNNVVPIPKLNTTANPLIGPVPNKNSTKPAMKVVTLASAIAEKALSNPARIEACG